jgi:DNA end-binding protein Ku
MAATVWKGYISFGLVSVPIRLYAAARYEHVSFNMVHRVCGTRIKQQLFCPHCERVIERSETAKGYPIEKDHFVLVEDKELKEIQPESSEVMEIVEFVKNDDLDPIYYETSYYSVPETAGKHAYALLLKAMEEANVVAVAQVTMSQRERIVAIRPHKNGLALHTLYYPSEVREVADYGKTSVSAVSKRELQLAEQFVKQLTGKFEPQQFHDKYAERVLQLIESKGEGKAAPPSHKSPHLAPVIDLMDALKRSLEKKSGKTAVAAKSEKLQVVARKKPSRGTKSAGSSETGRRKRVG